MSDDSVDNFVREITDAMKRDGKLKYPRNVENFADAPTSIAAHKACKADKASLWAPRDVLIDMLKAIDSGEVDPDAIVIFSRERRKENDGHVNGAGFLVSSPDYHTTIGVAETGLFNLKMECRPLK